MTGNRGETMASRCKSYLCIPDIVAGNGTVSSVIGPDLMCDPSARGIDNP